MPEERELAKEMKATLEALIAKVKPNLRYLTTVIDINHDREGCSLGKTKVAVVAEDYTPGVYGVKWTLFVMDDGRFLLAQDGHNTCCPKQKMGNKCSAFYTHLATSGDPHAMTWEQFPFNRVVGGLQNMYEGGIARRQAHLDKLQATRDQLAQINQIINKP